MRKGTLFTVLAIAVAGVAGLRPILLHAQSAPPATGPATPAIMETHTLVLLVLSDDPPKLEPEAAAELQKAHLAHIGKMAESGKLLAAGPFGARDDEALRGMLIFDCPLDEARAMAGEDPAVKAGRLKVVCQTWYTMKGVMTFNKAPLTP